MIVIPAQAGIQECRHHWRFWIPVSKRIVRPPEKVKTADLEALWCHGGYPEPFLKRDTRFSRRWIDTLCNLHLGFLIRPWFKNVSRFLRKEPKWFLRDWASIEDVGERAETFVACHPLKAVDGWNDMGLGKFELGYLRDKEKREVDFLVVQDGKPWFLAEVKYQDESLSPTLKNYQDQLNAPFAFQLVIDADDVEADCFSKPGKPLADPARTLLSQFI